MNPETQSFRWINQPKLKVDAYVTTENRWFLFAQMKDAQISNQSWEDLRDQFRKTFEGDIVQIAGTRKLKNRSQPLSSDPSNTEVTSLWAVEGKLRFRLETKDVLNPGLFLDQTLNRRRLFEQIQNAIQENPTEKFSCLNLFSYTGSFSVTAAAAGIHEVTSVDTSRRYLQWEKLNHEANRHHYRLDVRIQNILEDAGYYLKKCWEKKRKFHWIIIDPPTFSRSDKKVFQIQKHLPLMIAHAVNCLEEKGCGIFVSTNDHQWHPQDFFELLENIARKNRLNMQRGDILKTFNITELKSAWLLKPTRLKKN